MSVRDLMSAAAASAAQRDNDDDPKVGRPTNTFKVVNATDSDPFVSFSRVAHASRDPLERNGVTRRESPKAMLVHAHESVEPSHVSEPSPTCLQVDRTRDRTATSIPTRLDTHSVENAERAQR